MTVLLKIFEIILNKGTIYISISNAMQPKVQETFEKNQHKYPLLEDAMDAKIKELKRQLDF